MAEQSIFPCVFVLLSLLPGSLGDNYTIGGLVASSIVSFFAFVAMIVMLILVITWNQWFPQFQKWRGRTKQPRPVKPKFNLPPKQNGTQSIRLSTQSMSRPSSGPPTPRVSKVQNGAPAVYTANPTDTWIQEIQSTAYEEKVGQMSFDEEEVIVTELVKETTQDPAPPPPSGLPQSNGHTQTVKADEIQLTLEKQPMEAEKTTDGVMDFHFGVDDDAVVNLSSGKQDSDEGEMILY
uniref:Uncharacterized protein LOC111117981 n=1 Tax=Crassostrea virginica TaxID=6565 RepID=A0A8B8CB07_CRAVI|nr:uncharacterized protein LOC111117981 [Crassostrea virginica]